LSGGRAGIKQEEIMDILTIILTAFLGGIFGFLVACILFNRRITILWESVATLKNLLSKEREENLRYQAALQARRVKAAPKKK